MTPEQIDALSGQELDKAVAHAIELTFSAVTTKGEYDQKTTTTIFHSETGQMFRPSSDWNDAMFAAEKAGLFDATSRVTPTLRRFNGKWQFQHINQNGSTTQCNKTTDHSGPTTICREILKLYT